VMWGVSRLGGGGFVVSKCPAFLRCMLHAYLEHTILSDDKPDDGQCWPKHVVFIIF